jgi:hypothetical protein
MDSSAYTTIATFESPYFSISTYCGSCPFDRSLETEWKE